jgi:predicted  nucleic acid-binding Zn ribbon protein
METKFHIGNPGHDLTYCNLDKNSVDQYYYIQDISDAYLLDHEDCCPRCRDNYNNALIKMMDITEPGD